MARRHPWLQSCVWTCALVTTGMRRVLLERVSQGRSNEPENEPSKRSKTTAHIGARYGAFPAADAWYVSGGRFPSSADLDDGALRISENIHLERNSTQLKFTKHSSTEKAAAHRRTQLDPFTAGIAKSEDQ